ncbi:hypothetical protein [Empedobacter brevis]|uniref:hypothetical protein n=1 Tax=Empedobacter brevis TaxID=247 RepID=UPI00289C9CD3|nr:hypothetical protein [Empedobacter brevis]
MTVKLKKITETANVSALDRILNQNNIGKALNRKQYTPAKIELNGELINLQKLSFEDTEFVNGRAYELFIIDNFGFYFDFDSDFQDYTTNNGNGDINWRMLEHYLTELAFVQDFNIQDNPIFEDGKVSVTDEVKSLILKIASEKYYKSEEV